MISIVLALAATLFPLAAHAGENVAYTVDGEAFEGYRAKPTGASKGLVVIIHAWGGVTEYEQKRADMIAALGYDAFALDLYGKGKSACTKPINFCAAGGWHRRRNVAASSACR